MDRLTDFVVLVTGGARGMGASHVRGLVAEGAKVVIGDVLDDDGRALADELGKPALFVHLDVTDEQSWKDAIAATEEAFGPVDALINNAGVVQFKPWLKTTTAEWRRVLDINLTAQFIGIREILPSMLKTGRGGVVVNVSSTAGLQGFAAEPAYVASKWGVRGLTKAAALEFAQQGIRVVSVHPGVVETPMTTEVTEESYVAQPIPRKGRTAEVTALMIYLLADATYSTGSEFVIDGGAVLGPVVPVPLEED
ncbi:SDR family NAD(P)-dependent oxidoreductase [Amycolatopsis acidicola]|uniref:SDR family NAD(P)-dependent oxidoreductase n=1 Tax=Amycolatopsis acidicola TaxID=2596893 RepID=A0A5N0UXR3_9PSEU|nr:SDR family NAD(P)-dependent oxidoreductase [Amycolatopsis acidicola]KAA9157326.1 SDR family NAD(P)-dependent oxidoreductase [Amycolatopsis acidicola]